MIRVTVLPHDLPHATLLAVPADWLKAQTDDPAPGGRYRTAHELYELLFGEFSACSVSLRDAEAAVREHLMMYHGGGHEPASR